MSVSGPRDSIAIAKAMEMAAVSAEPEESVADGGGNHAQGGKPAQDAAPAGELTAESVSAYLRRTSAVSCDELDALIGALRRLRETLAGDSDRIEQGIADFATLNQSVIKLTHVVSDGVAHVQAPASPNRRAE
jgi:hypothetical protein